MKIKNIILSFLSLVLVVLLCSTNLNQVKAEEDTWYSDAAKNANNPILLEDEQYYQGITINSHLISDLTLMEIPFNEYLVNSNLKAQLITFSEAIYTQDGEIKSELVAYVYYPDDQNGDNQYMYTNISFKRQEALYQEGYVDVMSDGKKSQVMEISQNTLCLSMKKHMGKYLLVI